MKTTTFLLFASFLVASSFLSTSCSSIDLSTPIAAWSGADAAAGASSPAVHSNTVGVSQLSQSLLSLLGLGGASSSPSLFGAFESAPELAVFFIEPTLTTHNFYQLTGAFDASSARPAFATVRKMLEGKTSTLLENVELFADMSSVVGALVTRQLTAHITSTAVLVNGDNDAASQALLAAFPQRVQRVAADQLADHLRAHPGLCSNGVTDVVVYRFDAASSPAEHDAAIESITATVEAMSKDVVFFLGSQENPEVDFPTATPRYVRAADPNEPTQPLPPKIYSSLFPPGIFSGLITAAFLVIVLLIGICCICYSQTPDRFPEAIREGQVNHHILYPTKQ